MDDRDKKILNLLRENDSESRYQAPAQEWSEIQAKIERSERGFSQLWFWGPVLSGLLVSVLIVMSQNHNIAEDEELAEFLADSYIVLEEDQGGLFAAYAEAL